RLRPHHRRRHTGPGAGRPAGAGGLPRERGRPGGDRGGRAGRQGGRQPVTHRPASARWLRLLAAFAALAMVAAACGSRANKTQIAEAVRGAGGGLGAPAGGSGNASASATGGISQGGTGGGAVQGTGAVGPVGGSTTGTTGGGGGGGGAAPSPAGGNG